RYLVATAVYARDTWDAPMDKLRRLDDAEMDDMAAQIRVGLKRLYRRIAGMTRRDRIMAGMLVYTREMMMPFARMARVWDRCIGELAFDELSPVTAQAYYDLASGKAMEVLPPVFILGEGFP